MDAITSNVCTNNVYGSSIEWFEEVSEKADVVQGETLRRILETNCGVEYLKKWLGDMKTVKEMDTKDLEALYTSRVPLASHADLEPFIQRIADGDTSPLLTRQQITTLSLSSGTTDGRQKFVPFTPHTAKSTVQIFSLAAAYRSRVYPIREGGRILEFIYSSKQARTKGGLVAGTATTHYYASQEFKIKQEKTKSFTCSPLEVISGGDYNQSTYCHLLLGLIFSNEVEFIASAFAYTIVQAFVALEEVWREVCVDIREGGLSSRITVPRMRKAVLGMISPNPALASRIEGICKRLEEDEDWEGVIPKLWPNAKYIYSIMTGSMLHYLKKLRHYGGGLGLVSADYGSTESWIGVNVEPRLAPESVTFAVVPTFSYFEFIPLKKDDCSSKHCPNSFDDFIEDDPVPLSKLKLGQQYEVILTTFTGLYRYRLGDVVEVAGFHGKTPKLNFICRRKMILTVNIDKNTERDLQVVVEKASQLLTINSKAELVDYTSHAEISDSSKQPGHYKIYWEIKGDVEERVLRECCNEIDGSFVDHGYVVSRRTNSIGALELCIVERGTFKKILDYYIGLGAGLSQFKTPRCITNNRFLLSILDDCTVKSFFSTAHGSLGSA